MISFKLSVSFPVNRDSRGITRSATPGTFDRRIPFRVVYG